MKRVMNRAYGSARSMLGSPGSLSIVEVLVWIVCSHPFRGFC